MEFKQYYLKEKRLPDLPNLETIGGKTILKEGSLESPNYKTNEKGWKIDSEGNAEFQGLTVDSLDIPDTTTANSFHVDVDGNTWWGATLFASAVASISKLGAAIFSSISITGGTISGASLASIPNNTSTDISLLELTHDLVFSVTDADTIAWATGTINLSNGRTFTIDAGNTGNMVALTYIYLDTGASSTVLQTTTTYSTAMGANKVLLGTAQNHAVTASFIPFHGGHPLVDGTQIGALSIVAGNIAATTITAAKMNVSTLSSITADVGSLTAGKIATNSLTVINQRTSGAAYSANDALYLKKSDGKVYKADATASDEKIFNFMGFARDAATAADETHDVYEQGIIPGFSGLTAGSWYYLTNTAGAISDTPGTYFKRVGMAMSATEIYIIRDNLRTAQADGTFSITDLAANPGSTTITTGFRPSLIISRWVHNNDSPAIPAWQNHLNGDILGSVAYWTSWFSGLHRGLASDIDVGGALDIDTTALMHDDKVSRGNPKFKIASLTDTGFSVTLSNDGINVNVGHRWEVIAIA